MQIASYSLAGTGRIPLRRKDGSVCAWTSVDLSDFALALERRWYQTPNGYVIGHIPGSSPKAKMMLHRFLLGLVKGDGHYVDHIDRNRLNNRRSNIRVCTQAENNQNTSGWGRRSSSRHRGVCWYARDRKWQAEATIGYQTVYLGRYATEAEAARVAKEYRRAHMPHNVEPEMAA